MVSGRGLITFDMPYACKRPYPHATIAQDLKTLEQQPPPIPPPAAGPKD